MFLFWHHCKTPFLETLLLRVRVLTINRGTERGTASMHEIRTHAKLMHLRSLNVDFGYLYFVSVGFCMTLVCQYDYMFKDSGVWYTLCPVLICIILTDHIFKKKI